jgi:hypothetical protein
VPDATPRFPRRGKAVIRLRGSLDEIQRAECGHRIAATAGSGCGTILIDAPALTLTEPTLRWLAELCTQLAADGTRLQVAVERPGVAERLHAAGLARLLAPAGWSRTMLPRGRP